MPIHHHGIWLYIMKIVIASNNPGKFELTLMWRHLRLNFISQADLGIAEVNRLNFYKRAD